jgi:Asp-tRNA(Asn)/Glu-tRNA(Gln) amidotransferase A subunit family amidase
LPEPKYDFTKKLTGKLPEDLKIGVLREAIESDGVNQEVKDAFKNAIRWARTNNGLTAEQVRFLGRYSESIKSIEQADDFYIDAFSVLQSYLRIFNKEDAHIIKNETERIMKITQWAIRNAALESIGI